MKKTDRIVWHIILIATWKMDSSLMTEMSGDRVQWLDGNGIVKFRK